MRDGEERSHNFDDSELCQDYSRIGISNDACHLFVVYLKVPYEYVLLQLIMMT